MSSQFVPEHVCYVHCNFCNTILAGQLHSISWQISPRSPSRFCRERERSKWHESFKLKNAMVSVPGNSLFSVVTVRCGHCANLLSVNMGALLQPLLNQDLQIHNNGSQELRMEYGSSSKCNRNTTLYSMQSEQQHMLPIRSPEKRQRVPSAYNRFIKEEIQRIKANNPDISHREAFSAAAKNWAHFPRIHFGLTKDSGKQANDAIAAPGGKKPHGF